MRYDGYKSRLTGTALREHHEREKRQARAFDRRRMQATFKSALASSNRAPVTLPRLKFMEVEYPTWVE